MEKSDLPSNATEGRLKLSWRGFIYPACVVAVLGASSCAKPPLEMAFGTKMETKQSDKIIGEYCVSCHVHKNFDEAKHVDSAKASYSDPDYSSATNCRNCHTYTKSWTLNERRTTHWPKVN